MALLVTKMSCVARSTSSGCGAHGEGGRHGAAAGGAAHDVEGQARLQQRLVEADVGRAVGAAAAGDEAERRAVDEAVEPLDVADVVERHVMVHGDVAAPPASAPCRRWAPCVSCSSTRRCASGGSSSAASRSSALGSLVGRMQADGEHQVGLADRLLRPGRQLRLGDEQHVVVVGLQRVERARRLGAVDARRWPAAPSRAISGRTSMVRLLRRNTRVRPTTKAGGSSLAPARISVTVRGRGSGGGAPADVGLRHAPGQRHGQRAPDRRALGRQLLELGASQPQHQAVAQRGHGGGAHAAGKEGDLADRLAGTQLGDRLAAACRR